MTTRQLAWFDKLHNCYYTEVQYDFSDNKYTTQFKKFLKRCLIIVANINDHGEVPKYGRWVLPLSTNEWMEHITSVSLHIDSHKYIDKGNIQLVDNVRASIVDYNPIMAELLSELLLKISFNPANVRKNNVKGVVNMSKVPVNKDPGVSHIVLSLLAIVDSEFDFEFPCLSGTVWDVKHGIGARYMAGNSEIGYLETLNKMGANIVQPRKDVTYLLINVADSFIYRMGIMWRTPRPMDFSEENIREMLWRLNSSTGWYNDKIYRCDEKGSKRILKTKKKNLASEAHKLVWRLLFAIEEYVAGRGPQPNYAMFAQEAKKWEFRTTNMWSEPMTKESASAHFTKERLFYIDTLLAYILGKEFFKDLAFFLCTFRSAIGIKVEAGGLQLLWDLLSGKGTSNFKKSWKKAYRRVKKKYGVDLSVRKYFTLDWTKYDQTLLAKILAFMAAIVIPFVSKPEGMSDAGFKYLVTLIITEVVYKSMYIYSTNSVYDVWGSMFSGKYCTSIGDSVYQMLVFGVYILVIYIKYYGDPIVKVVFEEQMMNQDYYGDDNIGGWPAWMDNRLYYDDSKDCADDFVNFCERTFGLQCKRKEFHVFTELYGTHCFRSLPNGVIELEACRPGPTFIRNSVSHIYLDDVYLGDYPYRDTEDLVTKISRVMSASSSVVGTMCLVASLARLCSGNLVVFSQLKIVFGKLYEFNGPPTSSEIEAFKKQKHSNSINRMLANSQFDSDDLFPSLIKLHDLQNEGYCSRTGFNPSMNGVVYDGTNVRLGNGKVNVRMSEVNRVFVGMEYDEVDGFW